MPRRACPRSAPNADVPGPGAYEPACGSERGPAWTIATAARAVGDARDDIPGPGDYSVVAPGRGRAFTIAGKAREPRIPEATPGPGQYGPRGGRPFGEGAPAFTIGVRHEEDERGRDSDAGPEPGCYEVDRSGEGRADRIAWSAWSRGPVGSAQSGMLLISPLDAIGRCLGLFSMGISPRCTPAASPLSCGHLPLPCLSALMWPSPPSVPLRSRVAISPLRCRRPSSLHAGWRDGPAFTFGASSRGARRADDSALGPGKYDVAEPSAGPAFTFGARTHRETAPEDGPGPGEAQHVSFQVEGPAFTVPKAQR